MPRCVLLLRRVPKCKLLVVAGATASCVTYVSIQVHWKERHKRECKELAAKGSDTNKPPSADVSGDPIYKPHIDYFTPKRDFGLKSKEKPDGEGGLALNPRPPLDAEAHVESGPLVVRDDPEKTAPEVQQRPFQSPMWLKVLISSLIVSMLFKFYQYFS